MSYKDVGSRRLNLQAALGSILRAMPGLWLGAAGALLVCTAVWLVPVFVALTGWTGPVWAFAAGLTTLVAVGGLARLSVTEDVRAARALGLGPAGLQFGWPEVRLVGSALFCLIFLAMIVIVLALLVLAIFGTAGLDVAAIQAGDWDRVGSPWKLGLLAVPGAAALLIPLLLVVRLSGHAGPQSDRVAEQYGYCLWQLLAAAGRAHHHSPADGRSAGRGQDCRTCRTGQPGDPGRWPCLAATAPDTCPAGDSLSPAGILDPG